MPAASRVCRQAPAATNSLQAHCQAVPSWKDTRKWSMRYSRLSMNMAQVSPGPRTASVRRRTFLRRKTTSGFLARRHVHADDGAHDFLAVRVMHAHGHGHILGLCPLAFLEPRRGGDVGLGLGQVLDGHAARNPAHA